MLGCLQVVYFSCNLQFSAINHLSLVHYITVAELCEVQDLSEAILFSDRVGTCLANDSTIIPPFVRRHDLYYYNVSTS